MCGRYSLGMTTEALAAAFWLVNVPQLRARFNIAPTQPAPVVRLGQDGARHLDLLHWGLIPSWADDPKIGNRMINARAESAAEKPAFRSAFRKRRCLVPADGFYEWMKTEGGKIPHFIRRRDGQPFAFAGFWESWRDQSNREIESFTILTTEPNDVTRPIHNRMPAIILPDQYQEWLDPKQQDAQKLGELLRPAPP